MKAFFRRKEMKRPPRLLAPIGRASTSSFLFDAFFPSKLYSSFSFFSPDLCGALFNELLLFPPSPAPS